MIDRVLDDLGHEEDHRMIAVRPNQVEPQASLAVEYVKGWWTGSEGSCRSGNHAC